MTIKVVIEGKLAHLPLLRKAIRGICSCVVQNEEFFQDIDLCLNEALSNIIYHAYQSEPGHEIQIIVNLYPKEVVFQIVDWGLKNPIGQAEPVLVDQDLTNIDSLSESGRGLFIIHQLMDEVAYKREEDKNILILRKKY